jgi:predicted ArsR family transcriptional regulator
MSKPNIREKPGLYKEILGVIAQDTQRDGLTAYAISRALGVNDMTVRKYLDDLVTDGRLTRRKVSNLILYRASRTPVKG